MIEHAVRRASLARTPSPAEQARVRASLEAAARAREVVARMGGVYGPHPLQKGSSLEAAANFSTELPGFEEKREDEEWDGVLL